MNTLTTGHRPVSKPIGGDAAVQVNVKISIPELPDVTPFWIRQLPVSTTFEDLYQECINHSSVPQHPNPLVIKRASRHFWLNRRLFRRTELLAELKPEILCGSPQSHEALQNANPEFSLILRCDYYGIGPSRFVKEGDTRLYINAEDSIEKIISDVLVKEENACCFDLCDHTGKRISRDRTLQSESLLPAWEDEAQGEFPASAMLTLRPRVSWQPQVLYLLALLTGGSAGFLLYSLLMHLKQH